MKEICKGCGKLKKIYRKKKQLCQYCASKKYIYGFKVSHPNYYKEYYQKNKKKYKHYTGERRTKDESN